MLQRRHAEAPPGAVGFLEHHLDALQGEGDETLIGAIEHHREADHADAECQRAVQVGHIEFRNWAGPSGHYPIGGLSSPAGDSVKIS